MRPPVYGISRSPLASLRARDMRTAPSGVEIGSLAPPGMFMCRCNGEWLSRASWGSLTRGGDVIEWHEVPQDREDWHAGLRVGATLLAFIPGIGTGLSIAAHFALNILFAPVERFQPIDGVARLPNASGDSYSASLGGNTSKLDEPIWKICGRKEITPPFAGHPYLEYLPRPDEEDPDLDRDQFFFALYAASIDEVDIVAAKIGNTPISRYADVIQAVYLPPGVMPPVVDYNGTPLQALANVSTADEVSNQTLETGRYVGGYAANAPQRTAAHIGIDVAATRGLGKGSDPLSVQWRVETRLINDFGQVLGNWEVLATESRTAYTSTPQRWTVKYDLTETGGPGVGRYEVRVVRLDVKDEEPDALHELAWIGLRAYLAEDAPLNAHTGHYALIMRATSQMSASSTSDLRLIVNSRAPSLNTDLELEPATYTRNPAWWLLDLCTSSTWGLNKPLSRVDAQSFYDLAQTCEARQDRFDYVFDTSVGAWDAMQLIARSCRSRVFRRNGVISVARDELAEIPVTAFTPRNCQPGMGISETLRRRKSPDGVVVEYQDYRTNEWTPIECPMPGVSESDMERPVRIRLPGITGPTHAQREGMYEAASMRYRTRIASWVTEMQGLLPAYMSPVDFLPDIQGYGASGDVAAWDAGTLTMTLTEPPDWTQAPLFLTLIRDDGTLTDPVEVEEGDTAFEAILPEAPDFTLVIDDGNRERPKYLIGRKELVKVSGIEDGGQTDEGAQLYRLRGVIDDERVHEADVALLPGSGEEQDEPLDPNDVGDGGADVVVTFYSDTIQYTGGDVETLANMYARFKFGNNGILTPERGSDAVPTQESFPRSNQWVLSGAVDPSVADDFEIRFDLVATVDPTAAAVVTIPSAGTWLSLGTTRTIEVSLADGENDLELGAEISVAVRCRIRDVATEIVQEDRTMTMKITRI